MPMSHARADDALNAALRDGATPHVWLHTADPGPDGSGNVAQNDTADIDRKAVSFAVPANHPSEDERQVASDVEVEWTGGEIDAGQEITHVTVWSAATSGQVEFIYALPGAVTVGSDGVKIAPGDLSHGVGVYAKPA